MAAPVWWQRQTQQRRMKSIPGGRNKSTEHGGGLEAKRKQGTVKLEEMISASK